MAIARALGALLAAYAALIFARSRVAGALVVAATFTEPALGAGGFAALVAGAAGAKLLGVAGEGYASSPYAPNALLVGLGVAHAFAPSPAMLALAIAAGGASVVVTAALTSASARLGALPVLSIPFVLVTWILHASVAPGAWLAAALPAIPPVRFDVAPIEASLDAFGSLVFAPWPRAGALILAALVVHSRIATSLAIAGALVVAPLAAGPLGPVVALNGALAAAAIGGAWFVPSASSFALGGVGAILAAAITASLAAPLAAVGVEPLILPFAIAVNAVLLATRQRVFDRRPKSVDFVPGSPEENLAYYRTRVARFRAPYAIAFRLPFRGAWTCTQGNDGEHTHRGAWRHGLDFEVMHDDGRAYRGDGASLEDHACFKLPVLAAADGVVVKVVDDVADNAIGAMELARNWGNVVVVQHAPGLCSLVAHLARGSARVREGQAVRAGDVLGACGSSGRSPRPHLHFQLQATAQLGAPTLPCRFGDAVVRADDRDEVDAACLPREGDLVRNVEPDERVAACTAFDPGRTLVLKSDAGIERLACEVDLLGQRVLRSIETGAVLHFARAAEGLTTYEVLGAPRSILHAVRAALGRVPFEAGLRWVDWLPARWTAWPLLRPVRDLVSPFVPSAGLAIAYRAELRGDRLHVIGASLARRHGAPIVETEAVLSPRGIESIAVRAGRHAWRAEAAGDEPRAARSIRAESRAPSSTALAGEPS